MHFSRPSRVRPCCPRFVHILLRSTVLSYPFESTRKKEYYPFTFPQIRKSRSFQPFPSATRIAFREVSIDNHRVNLTVEILISNFHCSFGEIIGTEHGTRKVVKSTRTRLFTFWKLNFFVYSFVDSTKAISWSVILKLYEFTT